VTFVNLFDLEVVVKSKISFSNDFLLTCVSVMVYMLAGLMVVVLSQGEVHCTILKTFKPTFCLVVVLANV